MAMLACLISACVLAQTNQISGRVVWVGDGDTLEVLHAGKPQRIRLFGVDCPELGQAYGRRAREFTSRHAADKTVTVNVVDRDRYDRLVGEVILPNGQSLNRILVENGLAWWYRQFSKDKTLGELEATARRERRGLWADKSPVPPWEWRRTEQQRRQEKSARPNSRSTR